MTTLSPHHDRAEVRAPTRSAPRGEADVFVAYQPILDVARGIVAGYQAVATTLRDPEDDPDVRRRVTIETMAAALAARGTLPTNTFMSLPVPLALVDDERVCTLLAGEGDLRGVVLDITDFDSRLVATAEVALDRYRRAGASIAVGGGDSGQPELGSIVRLRPAMIRLGSAWTREIDQHLSRRTAIEVTGRLAGQLDAWVLADEVMTPGELRVLAQLGVPLARGPFIGEPQTDWTGIGSHARTTLPPTTSPRHGALRDLVQQAYTTTDEAAAQSVLPDASGFETVVVIDDSSHPVSLLQQGSFGRWEPAEVLTVHVDTPVADAVARAMARPVATRFSPIACTDAAGRFVGILRIERLMEHLVTETQETQHPH